MSCAAWAGKLEAYFDGELPAEEARAFAEHLRGCTACSAQGLSLVQQKRAVQAAGMMFKPDAAFRARIQKSTAPVSFWKKSWLPVSLTAAVTALLIFGVLFANRGRGEQQLLSELVDQHVATLASPNPVDVVSTDRHTVKPWFEGKIPFTFNVPELKGTQFTLVGGRVAYLGQAPGAELIFRVRQHQISVFIFQGETGESVRNALSYEVRSWSHSGLRYFMVGDAAPQDLDGLRDLIRAAG